MKKSNIILISILSIFMLLTIIITVHLRYTFSNIEEKMIELQFDKFDAINIGKGWRINLIHGDETDVFIFDDSIRNYISLDGNILNFKDIQGKNGRIKADISNNFITHINASGNSILKYNAEYIDSLFITQKERSRIIIQNVNEFDDTESEINKKSGVVNFMDIKLRNHSRIEVYNIVNNLSGDLCDTSFCMFTNSVAITKFSKSKTSEIKSW